MLDFKILIKIGTCEIQFLRRKYLTKTWVVTTWLDHDRSILTQILLSLKKYRIFQDAVFLNEKVEYINSWHWNILLMFHIFHIEMSIHALSYSKVESIYYNIVYI